jgi:hypothetical protein
MSFAPRLPAALTLVILLIGSIGEPAIGLLRDGVVHHESPSSAAAHRGGASGYHGHEDLAAQPGHQHGAQHEHGTASDHCTHAHGVGLPSFVMLYVPGRVSVLGDERALSWLDHPITTLSPPPKA